MEKRSIRVSAAQWEIMLHFLTENPSLVRGYHNSSRGRDQASRLWNRLANQLNAQGSGTSKTSKEWATYFNNFKSKLKKRVSDLNREGNATGGGAATAESLTEIETRLLSIMGPGFGQGLPSVRVNPFPEAGLSEPRSDAHEPPEEVVDIELGTEEQPVLIIHVQQEVQASESSESQPRIATTAPPSQPTMASPAPRSQPRMASPIQPSQSRVASPAPPSQPSVPLRTRRTRYRARPMAPIDEARRILSEVEKQRAASDAATARAMQLIGENLGRIATAMERYVENMQQGHQEDQNG